ncbi:venom prothrombin activator oscutarin-C non-catalytic subunit-like isoform X1 [Actinia tenebrosa]|uniref:Venom prothrombin activator oscutarin-C non-catalytic subunit-like isoform X1 n=1 Tax=Actinia tenebrosa TaxID=6105 RepID=A0A6P8IHY9_ACTTE|nr:venom prothrombin activator oscutarin-C non-catalytic subunit-like isoform X1 [Actinia tenebrosa]
MMAKLLLWCMGLLLLYRVDAAISSASPEIQDIEENFQEMESTSILTDSSDDQSADSNEAIDDQSENAIESEDLKEKVPEDDGQESNVQSDQSKSAKRQIGNSVEEKHRCSLPLGMEDGRIPDSAITASSEAAVGTRASRSRLNTVSIGASGYGAWVATKNDNKQWLQIDLGDLAEVTRVATQGRQDADQWTKLYSLSYSVDNVHWVEYKANSYKKIFSANTDRNTIVSHNLTPSIKARFIKFHVTSAQNRPALRVELYGCRKVHSCAIPVGIEDGRIPDSAMTASSINSAATKADRGRLNLNSHGWISRHNNPNQYLRIDLGKETSVTKVATQGRFNVGQWVTSYYLRYSLDGTHWVTYKQNSVDKIFSGNADQNTIVSHVLNPRIEARFIEFKPRTWKGHIVMRVEVYGCNSMPGCHLPLGLEDNRIPNAAMSASTIHSNSWKADKGRLNGPAAWLPKKSTPNEYIQVDFVRALKVTSVATHKGDLKRISTSKVIGFPTALMDHTGHMLETTVKSRRFMFCSSWCRGWSCTWSVFLGFFDS